MATCREQIIGLVRLPNTGQMEMEMFMQMTTNTVIVKMFMTMRVAMITFGDSGKKANRVHPPRPLASECVDIMGECLHIQDGIR